MHAIRIYATGLPITSTQTLANTQCSLIHGLYSCRAGSKRICSIKAPTQLLAPRRQQTSKQLHRLCVAAASSSDTAQNVSVRFSTTRQVSFGDCIALVGDHSSLGKWKPKKAARMQWSEGDIWQSELTLPAGTTVEYKCILVKGDGQVEWEEGANHHLSVPSATATYVTLAWGDGQTVETDLTLSDVEGITVNKNEQGFAVAPAFSSEAGSDQIAVQAEVSESYTNSTFSDSSITSGLEGTTSNNSSSNSSGSSSSSVSSIDEAPLPGQWKGNDVVFMKSNDHKRERSGQWNTQNLDGIELALVKGDEGAASWLHKLELAKRYLVDEAPRLRPTSEALAAVYVYLTWVATGALPCVESGGHRRPNHHANIAKEAFRSLEWVVDERGLFDGDVALGNSGWDGWIARRLQTKLPAFTDSFTQSTPLTRIRDIAHRNDIPHDLKQEIKHTIQNKLHRNAGPEDLVATELLLERVVSNQGQYPESFVNELKLFTAELRDFFNAGSLASALDGCRSALDEASNKIIDHFLGAKNKLDNAGAGADLNTVMDALHGVTTVRALLMAGLSSGMRNDAPDTAIVMRQRWRLAEIRAEDYTFVLLSRFINSIEQSGGAAGIAGRNSDGAWALPIGASVLALRNIGLAGHCQAECMALENDLATWQKLGGLQHKDEGLRLKSTLQRVRRLCDGYSEGLVAELADRAVRMGDALGLPRDMYEVFAESEIRASVAFQLSKLTSILLKATNEVTGGGSWDVLVTGQGSGTLIEVDRLEPDAMRSVPDDQSVVLVVNQASGDEEVGSLGKRLAGVLLKHDVPHLSHLGVRARQEQVPFACCEDEAVMNESVKGLVGKKVWLNATPDGLELIDFNNVNDSHRHHAKTTISDSTSGSTAVSGTSGFTSGEATSSAAKSVSGSKETKKVSSFEILPLQEATVDTCGAKAATCAKLLTLATATKPNNNNANNNGSSNGASPAAVSSSTALFAAPDGVCLPYGCMEVTLDSPENKAVAGRLKDILSSAEAAAAATAQGGSTAALDALCEEAQGLIKALTVPQWALQRIAGAFDPGMCVIVRSSANVEDLEELSGAGLYDSIPNINPQDPNSLQTAITTVWSSLHSRRAILARRSAHLSSSSACMAILIQRQLAPQLSFVLHTVHPLTDDKDVLVAEVAPGLGEILASGTRGTAWRLQIKKKVDATSGKKEKPEMLAFANFSKALLPIAAAGGGGSTAGAVSEVVGGARYVTQDAKQAAVAAGVLEKKEQQGNVAWRAVQYSQLEMSCSEDYRNGVAERLVDIGVALEDALGGAQDVEGCVENGRVFVVQSRPQM